MRASTVLLLIGFAIAVGEKLANSHYDAAPSIASASLGKSIVKAQLQHR